jgi:hypothetical protein
MRRAALLLVITVLVVLSLSTVAFAQTPQDIYNDYAQDGKLDGNYTNAQLQAYLSDANIHQYGEPATLTALDALVNKMIGHHEFPFTGAQVVLIAMVALGLVGTGLGMRRFARSRA